MQLWQSDGNDVQPDPWLQATEVHVTPWHVPVLEHCTSQEHELLHATFRHAFRPVHVTLQAPGPHPMSRHESWPLHSKLQPFAFAQLIPLRHAPVVLHLNVQV